MIDLIIRAASNFRSDRGSSRWASHAISQADEMRGLATSDRATVELTHRLTQWVAILAHKNASTCACQPLRLYRRAKHKRKSGPGFRRVDRKALDYLRKPSNLKLGLYARDTEDVEEVTDHPLLDLLRRPNPWQPNGDQMAYARFHAREWAGNAFHYLEHGAGIPTGLYFMAPQDVVIRPDKEQFIRGYRYGRDKATMAEFEPDEVMHSKLLPSPFNAYLGWTWVQWVILDADRMAASTINDLNMWRNAARPDWALKLPPGSNKMQVTEARENIRQYLKGPDKTHGVLIMTGDDIKPLQWSPKDLEGVASRHDARHIMATAAGVPMSEVDLNDSNYNNSRVGRMQYMDATVHPRLVTDACDLTEWLLPKFGLEPGEYWMQYDNPVPDDEKAILERGDRMVSKGAATINEWRQEQGLDAVEPEIGDVLRFNGVPLDVLASMRGSAIGPDGLRLEPGRQDREPADPTPAATAGATPTPGADVQDTALNGAQVTSLREILNSAAAKELPIETVEAMIIAAFPGIKPEQIAAMIAPLRTFEKPKPEPGPILNAPKPPPPPPPPPTKGRTKSHPAWAKGHDGHIHTKDDDDDYRLPPRATINQLEAEIAQWYAEVQAALPARVQSAAGTAEGLNITGMQGALAERLEPALTDLMRSVMRAEASRMGIADEFDVMPVQALDYIQHYTPKLAEEITLNTQEMLRDAMAEGIAGGESMSEMQVRVGEALGTEATYRAERIARTESLAITGRGNIEAWRAADVAQKRWILSNDTTCPMCSAIWLRGETRPIDEPFLSVGETIIGTDGKAYSTSWADIQAPPAHPNCRCAVAPVVE